MPGASVAGGNVAQAVAKMNVQTARKSRARMMVNSG